MGEDLIGTDGRLSLVKTASGGGVKTLELLAHALITTADRNVSVFLESNPGETEQRLKTKPRGCVGIGNEGCCVGGGEGTAVVAIN